MVFVYHTFAADSVYIKLHFSKIVIAEKVFVIILIFINDKYPHWLKHRFVRLLMSDTNIF